jgi:SAM-dependent methyltransferase
VSAEHWTPLRVAVRAAAWLEEFDIRSVVDIGAGVGKFCVIGALAGRCRFVGFEQRGRLVDAARTLAQAFRVCERVEFVHGALGEVPTPLGEAYYFFNPFGENLYFDGHLDDDVELGDERYVRDVDAAQELLRHAPVGTYALTYNGFGGTIPAGYRQVRVDRTLTCELCLWRKASSGARAMARIEPQRAAGARFRHVHPSTRCGCYASARDKRASMV